MDRYELEVRRAVESALGRPLPTLTAYAYRDHAGTVHVTTWAGSFGQPDQGNDE